MISYYEIETLYKAYKYSMPSVDYHTIKEKIINILLHKYSYRYYNEIIRAVNMFM